MLVRSKYDKHQFIYHTWMEYKLIEIYISIFFFFEANEKLEPKHANENWYNYFLKPKIIFIHTGTPSEISLHNN